MAKKKNMKYTDEEMQAMRVMAMLQGVDPSTIQNEEVDDFEIEIEDEEKPKKRKAKPKEERVGSENQVFTTSMKYIEKRPEFESLKESFGVNITFNEHDIHYKEQLWGIPTRTVSYNIELVKVPKVAMDISERFSTNSDEEREKAFNGIVRYYKIVTYENVLSKLREVGYVKVVSNNGKYNYSIKVLTDLLKECKANPDNVKKNVTRAVKENIKTS